MTAESERVLVAGVGNIFLGDDGFGSEVVRQLTSDIPDGVEIKDYGIAGIHLAYALLEPVKLLLIVDALPRGEAPRTVYVFEPSLDSGIPARHADAHGMDIPSVFASVQAMGGKIPRTLIVGCEPESVEEGLGLSPAVQAAIAPAANLVRELLHRERAGA